MPQTVEQEISSFNITMELQINAPIGTVFESVLAELGPEGEMPGGEPFPMVLEAFPGGRWYRDLGAGPDGIGAGHLWGHVQVIKPPALIELSGPMFMSYAATNFVRYRLEANGSITTLRLTHNAMGLIPPEHHEGVRTGWDHGLQTIKRLAERRA